MNLDWRRLKAVVFESDDWGLCAWAPDDQAHRVLVDTPPWRQPAGRIYGRSTLESAHDVERLVSTLLEFRGGDGFPPVWQANTIMAAPDFTKLVPPLFQVETLPLVKLPDTPSRWHRPGLWDQVTRAVEGGVWHPELHGLHHIPVETWLRALRRGLADARRAHEHQSFVCEAVEQSGEYDPDEPVELRKSNLKQAVECFETLFGRKPDSICAPDYRWDEVFEATAEELGVTTIQGKAEQHGHALPRLRRLGYRLRWPDLQGRRFFLPPRIAFEPRGGLAGHERVGVQAAHRAARAAWQQGQPAIISTHRANYASLDESWSERGRAALRDLLEGLVGDAAVFLTDSELRGLVDRGWSLRPIGTRGALLRYYGVPRDPIRFRVPPGTLHVVLKDSRTDDGARVTLEGGEVRAQVNPGEYLIEWRQE